MRRNNRNCSKVTNLYCQIQTYLLFSVWSCPSVTMVFLLSGWCTLAKNASRSSSVLPRKKEQICNKLPKVAHKGEFFLPLLAARGQTLGFRKAPERFCPLPADQQTMLLTRSQTRSEWHFFPLFLIWPSYSRLLNMSWFFLYRWYALLEQKITFRMFYFIYLHWQEVAAQLLAVFLLTFRDYIATRLVTVFIWKWISSRFFKTEKVKTVPRRWVWHWLSLWLCMPHKARLVSVFACFHGKSHPSNGIKMNCNLLLCLMLNQQLSSKTSLQNFSSPGLW